MKKKNSDNRLSLIENVILHSQYILLALLVGIAVWLSSTYGSP